MDTLFFFSFSFFLFVDFHQGYNGVDEIKAHAYFSDIDWIKLDKMEMEPPYKPNVENESDTQHIDKTFTEMPAAVTMTPAGARQLTEAAEAEGKDFSDFTFQGTNILDGKRYSMSAADLEAELDFGPEDM